MSLEPCLTLSEEPFGLKPSHRKLTGNFSGNSIIIERATGFHVQYITSEGVVITINSSSPFPENNQTETLITLPDGDKTLNVNVSAGIYDLSINAQSMTTGSLEFYEIDRQSGIAIAGPFNTENKMPDYLLAAVETGDAYLSWYGTIGSSHFMRHFFSSNSAETKLFTGDYNADHDRFSGETLLTLAGDSVQIYKHDYSDCHSRIAYIIPASRPVTAYEIAWITSTDDPDIITGTINIIFQSPVQKNILQDIRASFTLDVSSYTCSLEFGILTLDAEILNGLRNYACEAFQEWYSRLDLYTDLRNASGHNPIARFFQQQNRKDSRQNQRKPSGLGC